jgi:hypothetical protein
MTFLNLLIFMILFFAFIELLAHLLPVEEHKTIIPEPWDISGEEE